MSAKFLPFHFLPCREKNTDIYLFDPSLVLATQILINLCSSFQLVEIFNLLPSFLDVSYLIYFNVSFSYYIIYRSNIETNQCDKPLCHYAFFSFSFFSTLLRSSPYLSPYLRAIKAVFCDSRMQSEKSVMPLQNATKNSRWEKVKERIGKRGWCGIQTHSNLNFFPIS